MKEKKRFVEPEIVKYEEPLDKVTLNLNCYSTSSGKNGRHKKRRH